MNAELPDPGPTFTPDPALAKRSAAAWALVLGGCLVLGTALVLDLILPVSPPPEHLLGRVLVFMPQLLVLLTSLQAARISAPGQRAPWVTLGVGTLVHLAVRLLAGPGSIGIGLLAFHLALALTAILAMRRTLVRPRDSNDLLDAALTMAAAALLLQRFFSPGPSLAVPGVAAPAGLDPAQLVGVLPMLAALVSFFCTTLLALRPDYRLPRLTAPSLLAGAGCLLFGGALDARQIAAGAGGVGLFSTLGWLFLALAGLLSFRPRARAMVEPHSSRAIKRRLHQALIPGVALLLSAFVLDTALRPAPTTIGVGLTGAFLGLLLALRVRRTLQTGEERAESERLLAQNTALVEVSRALADATELSRTLDLVAHWACRLVGVPAAGVELLDAEQDELEIRALHGLPSHLLGLRTPVAGTLTGSVIRSGRTRAVKYLGGTDFELSERLAAFSTFPTAVAPLHYREQRLGTLFAIRFDRDFDDVDLELLSALADQASLAIRNAQLFEQVRALSLTDPLTGLANRRQLTRDLNREFAAATRGRPLIAVIFDLDNFKDYNDQYGHPAGDEVLRLFGEALAAETRAMNLAVRYGGDEFLVLLADNTLEGTKTFIERVDAHFRESMRQIGRTPVTVSAGYAEYSPAFETPADLVAAADKALYRVKSCRGVPQEP